MRLEKASAIWSEDNAPPGWYQNATELAAPKANLRTSAKSRPGASCPLAAAA